MNTLLITVGALVALGVVVAILDALPWGTETYTISTRDLPNTAAGRTTTDTTSDTSMGVRS